MLYLSSESYFINGDFTNSFLFYKGYMVHSDSEKKAPNTEINSLPPKKDALSEQSTDSLIETINQEMDCTSIPKIDELTWESLEGNSAFLYSLITMLEDVARKSIEKINPNDIWFLNGKLTYVSSDNILYNIDFDRIVNVFGSFHQNRKWRESRRRRATRNRKEAHKFLVEHKKHQRWMQSLDL